MWLSFIPERRRKLGSRKCILILRKIIPDYRQSHISYRVQFILNGSPRCRSQTDITHYRGGQKCVFRVSGVRGDRRRCSPGDLELNIIWGRLRHIWRVETLPLQKCCCRCTVTVYGIVPVLHIHSVLCHYYIIMMSIVLQRHIWSTGSTLLVPAIY